MSDCGKRSKWESVKELMGDDKVILGRYLSYQFKSSPRRILYSMSYYKFAAKVIGTCKRVLDVGCGEGLGTWLLATECGQAKGIDMDKDSIDIGNKNWKDPRVSFECSDFLNRKQDQCDALVILDVIEHILPENESRFFKECVDCLNPDGIAIIGTPNVTSQVFAKDITKAGHVNLFSGDRIEDRMRQYFSNVFIFGANDEVIHTGFRPMAHYLIAIGCGKRKGV
ncbi:MAG: class I SAM-dependent methyltransferase [Candidatus Omnitrophota bacterium]